MWVAEDAFGETLSFTRDGWEVEVKLPSTREDFGLYRPEWIREYPNGPFGGGSSGTAGTGNYVRHVTAIQVTVRGDAEVSAESFDSGDLDALREGFAHHDRALAVAESAAADFVGWVRVERNQPWLGQSHSRPPRIGLVNHWDEDADRWLRVGGSSGVVVQAMPRERAVRAEDVAAYAISLGQGEEPGLAESLLRDGQYLIETDPPNPAQAVLLAAIGSEVKVKQTLRARATPEALPFVEYILEKPREVTQAAASLVDTPMKLVSGRSLKEERRPLFNAVGKLFEDRNAVAHKAGAIDLQTARNHIKTALALFDWLDGV